MKEGRFEEAFESYQEAIRNGEDDPAVCCNMSLVAFKLGRHQESMEYAELALQELSSSPDIDETISKLFSRAYHRKAQAQLQIHGPIAALRTYKEGLTACQTGQRSELAAATRLHLDRVPVRWLAEYWCGCIQEAQKPHPMSSRDGLLLKPVPSQFRLDATELQSQLCRAMESHAMQDEARNAIVAVWSRGKSPGRAEIAFFRSLAYLSAEHSEQALKDAEVALAYGRHIEQRPAWPAALFLHSLVLERLGQNTPALISVLEAIEFDLNIEEAQHALERLLRRVPEHYAVAATSGGSTRLIEVIEEEKERSVPEFLKPRPKYYYYYEWMRRRLEASHPNLPEPVMDKILTLDATELDLLLRYPAAVENTLSTLTKVLEEKGEDILSTYAVPLLSYEETQGLEAALQAPEDPGRLMSRHEPLKTIQEIPDDDIASEKGSIDIEETSYDIS